MTTIQRQLQVLERWLPVGCDTCRSWNRTIVMTVDEDGTETGRSRPDAYPACGRVVAVGQALQLVGMPSRASLHRSLAVRQERGAGGRADR